MTRRRLWLVLAAAALLGLGLWSGRGPLRRYWRETGLPRGQRPAVVIVTLDSVRPDRIGAYASHRVKTPALDRLAQEGAVFAQAYVSSPLCVPSHATILTGRLPASHGIHDDQDFVLPDSVPTLASSFRQAGYATAAFVGSSTLDHGLGLSRGFETYADEFGRAGRKPGQVERASATAVVSRAVAWLSTSSGRPVFLWVHLADAMPPYTAPQPFAKDHAEEPYDAAVAYLDAEVGRLVEGVRRDRPGAVVAVLADHAEALGEHGEARHGYFAYSSTTRVPFVLAIPGRVARGIRVDSVVRTADLAPTLLDVAGLPSPAGTDGVSLVPLLLGRTRDVGPAVVENLAPQIRYGMTPLYAIRSGPRLYVRGARAQLYDVLQDPGEKDDASARLPSIAAALEHELLARVPGASGKGGLDPTDGQELYNRYVAALEAQSRGRCPEAIPAYRGVLAEHPGFTSAARKLGECLVREKRGAEAETLLRGLIDHDQANDVAYLNLALLRYRAGRPEEALQWLRSGVAARPRSAALRHRFGRLLLELKRYDESVRELTEATRLEPRYADAQLALGIAYEGLGRTPDARSAYRTVLDVAPESPEAGEAKQALQRLVEPQAG
jgi:choline-sulfatase